MKTDYTAEITALIKGNYEPVNSPAQETSFTVKKPLRAIHKEITSVLPSIWIDEDDVYKVLNELGFKSFMYDTEVEYDEIGEIAVPASTRLDYFLNRIV